MNRNEFVEAYTNVVQRALNFVKKARREGLLSLEDGISDERIADRDILEYGLHFVVDGIEKEVIEKILSNIVKQEKDEDMFILKTIQKEAVLAIQEGMNPRLIYLLLNSYTDITIKDDEMKKIIE
jgi:flagellar motor component MotA